MSSCQESDVQTSVPQLKWAPSTMLHALMALLCEAASRGYVPSGGTNRGRCVWLSRARLINPHTITKLYKVWSDARDGALCPLFVALWCE